MKNVINFVCRESIRIFVFLAILSAVVVFGWWMLLIAVVLFPKTFNNIKNGRNGKFNLGYLVNHLTSCLVK